MHQVLTPDEAATVVFQYLEWVQNGGCTVTNESSWQLVRHAKDPAAMATRTAPVQARTQDRHGQRFDPPTQGGRG